MSWWKEFADQAKVKLAQFNNAPFKDGMMAVCALIAAADGSVSGEEKSKVAGLIGKNPMLSAFNAVELRDLFLKHCDAAGDDFERIELLNLVRKLKGNESQADTALRVALVIANADNDFSAAEKKVVSELCGVLGLTPSAYLS